MPMSTANMWNNRPFYRYGGHIELTRFKEYLRIRSSIFAQYLRALFGTIFHKVFLELDRNSRIRIRLPFTFERQEGLPTVSD